MNPLIPQPVAIVLACIAGAMFAGLAAAPLLRIMAELWDQSRGNKVGRYVFLLAAAGAALFGGAKHKIGNITYPYTDVEQRYLTDAGSYVTNDAVHVAFSRIIAPESAPLLIDYRQIDSTNDLDWVNHTTTTFADFENPSDLQFPNATNYNWVVYTTWTPGPSVQTNGVWHAYWGLDRKNGRYLIPVRTCVRDGGIVIATPKSKWDHERAPLTIRIPDELLNGPQPADTNNTEGADHE